MKQVAVSEQTKCRRMKHICTIVIQCQSDDCQELPVSFVQLYCIKLYLWISICLFKQVQSHSHFKLNDFSITKRDDFKSHHR